MIQDFGQPGLEEKEKGKDGMKEGLLDLIQTMNWIEVERDGDRYSIDLERGFAPSLEYPEEKKYAEEKVHDGEKVDVFGEI